MTETEEFVKIMLPELLYFFRGEENRLISQKGLDNNVNPSIHTVQEVNPDD